MNKQVEEFTEVISEQPERTVDERFNTVYVLLTVLLKMLHEQGVIDIDEFAHRGSIATSDFDQALQEAKEE